MKGQGHGGGGGGGGGLGDTRAEEGMGSTGAQGVPAKLGPTHPDLLLAGEGRAVFGATSAEATTDATPVRRQPRREYMDRGGGGGGVHGDTGIQGHRGAWGYMDRGGAWRYRGTGGMGIHGQRGGMGIHGQRGA